MAMLPHASRFPWRQLDAASDLDRLGLGPARTTGAPRSSGSTAGSTACSGLNSTPSAASRRWRRGSASPSSSSSPWPWAASKPASATRCGRCSRRSSEPPDPPRPTTPRPGTRRAGALVRPETHCSQESWPVPRLRPAKPGRSAICRLPSQGLRPPSGLFGFRTASERGHSAKSSPYKTLSLLSENVSLTAQ